MHSSFQKPQRALRCSRCLPQRSIKNAQFSLNVSNLTDKNGASTFPIVAASCTFKAFLLAPRQVFATLSLGF